MKRKTKSVLLSFIVSIFVTVVWAQDPNNNIAYIPYNTFLKVNPANQVKGKVNKRESQYHVNLNTFKIGNSNNDIQHRYSLSVGITNKWTINNYKQSTGGTPDVVAEGGKGYFSTFGFCYRHDNEMNDDYSAWFNFTIEKYNSQLQNWERISIGNVNATILRIDPMVIYHSFENTMLYTTLNLIGISYFTGKGNLLPNSYCYDNGTWRLIKEIKIKNSVGWSLGGVEIGYSISSKLNIGIETVLLEADNFKVIFQTPNKQVNSDVFTAYGFLPLKLRFTIKL